MFFSVTNNQFQKRSGKIIREINKFWIGIVFLLGLITVVGCRERPASEATPQTDAEQQFWIRVLLLDDVKTCVLKIASPFSISDPCMQTTPSWSDKIDKPMNAEVSGGRITIAGQSFTGSEILISPASPLIFNLNGDDYRGRLKLIFNSDSNSFDIVNLVPLEPFLAGVIRAEMPDYWEEAALETQTIAARTYCLYIKRQFGKGRSWDMTKTQANQVYLGMKAESHQIWNAIKKTCNNS